MLHTQVCSSAGKDVGMVVQQTTYLQVLGGFWLVPGVQIFVKVLPDVKRIAEHQCHKQQKYSNADTPRLLHSLQWNCPA